MTTDALLPDKATLLLPFRPSVTNTQPRRVGVVIGSSHPPKWVHALLQSLREIPGIGLEILLLPDGPSELPADPGWLMERLYSASRQRFDPYTESELRAAELPVIKTVQPADIGGLGCDILIWLAARADLKTDLRSISKHGVFTVQLGTGEWSIPFWEEAAQSEPTTSVSILWHDVSLLSGRVVREAQTATVPGLYFTLNAMGPLVAAIRMLTSLCLALPASPAGESRPLAHRRKYVPQTLEVARFVSSKLARSAYIRLTKRGNEPKWFIAARRNTGASIVDDKILSGFNGLPVPAGSKEVADPFLWEADGHTWLLFEEIPEGRTRGRLAYMELLKDGSCTGMQPILERDYHLSYPCVVRSQGELFLLPESSAIRQVQLYRFTRFPSQIELVSLLAEDFAAVDTTPILVNDRWYFFTTTAAPFLETLLFWSDRLDGPWRLHPSSPVSCSVKNSRSAGQLFWKSGRLFRPTQDCSICYGYAITVNEVVRLTPTEFEERPVQWVPPSWMPGLQGTHTWNESDEWQVLDGLR